MLPFPKKKKKKEREIRKYFITQGVGGLRGFKGGGGGG